MVPSSEVVTNSALTTPRVWRPAWNGNPKVHAVTTQRYGGLSQASHASLNLATHVGDDDARVEANRMRLVRDLSLPAEPLWLNQVHGTNIANAERVDAGYMADGAVHEGAGTVLAVMTADCLPVFFADSQHQRIGIVHAGWRGLAAGIIERAIDSLGSSPDAIEVAFGPALSCANFEIGDEVREALMRPGTTDRSAFHPAEQPGKWYCDLYRLAALRVSDCGCASPLIPDTCTYRDQDRWFSYRRDVTHASTHSERPVPDTGRMASLIWIDG